MSTPQASDETFLQQITPIVTQTLVNEVAGMPEKGTLAIQRQTLATCLNIRRKAKKQRINQNLFAKRVTREQAQIWLATYGTATQQASAMNRIMVENRDIVARYITRFRFRTNDVADEVLNDTFAAFFNNLSQQKPVNALLSTCLIGIARLKALHQLRQERTDPTAQWSWIETSFVDIDDDMGALTWPLAGSDDESTYIDIPLPDNADNLVRITLASFREWLTGCFARLSKARQFLFQLRYKFWTEQDLNEMSMNEVEAIFNDLGMGIIAQMAGYTNAHAASVRLNESLNRLRDCLTDKLIHRAV